MSEEIANKISEEVFELGSKLMQTCDDCGIQFENNEFFVDHKKSL